MTSHDKVCAVISILQDRILAEDSAMDAQALFGQFRMPTAGLELAERLLTEVLDDLLEKV